MKLTLGPLTEKQRDRLYEIAERVGAAGQRGPSVSVMIQQIADGELEVRMTQPKMFREDEYHEAEAHAKQNNLPLWDTHTLPERYAVGYLSAEIEEDPDNADWEELEIE